MRREAGEHERGGGSEVGGHHGRPLVGGNASDDRDRAIRRDARAHPREFGHVHEPVFEDRLRHARLSVGEPQQRHDLRLHVGREPRKWAGRHIGGARPLGPAHAHRRRTDLERHPDKEQQRHKPSDAIASPPHQCQRQRDRARDLKLAKERDQGGNDVERIRGERLSQVEDLAVYGPRCPLGDEHGQYCKSQGEHTCPA